MELEKTSRDSGLSIKKNGKKNKCKLLHYYGKWLELGLESHFFITTTPNHQYLEMFGHVWFRKVGPFHI